MKYMYKEICPSPGTEIYIPMSAKGLTLFREVSSYGKMRTLVCWLEEIPKQNMGPRVPEKTTVPDIEEPIECVQCVTDELLIDRYKFLDFAEVWNNKVHTEHNQIVNELVRRGYEFKKRDGVYSWVK